jgi:hypothetical protein
LILLAYFSVCFEVPFGSPLLGVGEKERKENFKQFFITAKEEVGGGGIKCKWPLKMAIRKCIATRLRGGTQILM